MCADRSRYCSVPRRVAIIKAISIATATASEIIGKPTLCLGA